MIVFCLFILFFSLLLVFDYFVIGLGDIGLILIMINIIEVVNIVFSFRFFFNRKSLFIIG